MLLLLKGPGPAVVLTPRDVEYERRLCSSARIAHQHRVGDRTGTRSQCEFHLSAKV